MAYTGEQNANMKTLASYNIYTYNIYTNTMAAGGRLNIKTVLSTYGDFHVKDKTAVRTSYL